MQGDIRSGLETEEIKEDARRNDTLCGRRDMYRDTSVDNRLTYKYIDRQTDRERKMGDGRVGGSCDICIYFPRSLKCVWHPHSVIYKDLHFR